MKKVLVLLAAVALVAWVASWFWNEDAVVRAAGRPWPGGMGTLDTVGAHFPPKPGNAASRKLTALAEALPENEAVADFVVREVARGELAIGQAPVLPDVSAIRQLLLTEPVVWERYEGFDHPKATSRRAVHMTMARALVASGLAKARANDPAAWEDLHAVWKLARTLDEHPQMMVRTAALSMARMINAVAWKLPLPAPAWLAEVQARDDVGPLLEAFQYQAASYGDSSGQLFPTKFLASSVEHDRLIAEELFHTAGCVVNPRMNKLGTDLSYVWRRAFRFRAEREATANALRIREGKPIEPRSRCTEGSWLFDGTTLRFSKDIPPTGGRDLSIPLALRVKVSAEAAPHQTPR